MLPCTRFNGISFTKGKLKMLMLRCVDCELAKACF